jgi:hypothetical protein
MDTTRKRHGETTAVTWVGGLASGTVGLVQQGATWAWNGTWEIVDRATSPGRQVATVIASELGKTAERSWAVLQEHPYVGGVLAGAVGVGAAMVTGMGELAAGVAIGYGAYLMLAKGEAPMQAIGDAIAFERGQGPREGAAHAPAKRAAPARPRAAGSRAGGKKAPLRRR